MGYRMLLSCLFIVRIGVGNTKKKQIVPLGGDAYRYGFDKNVCLIIDISLGYRGLPSGTVAHHPFATSRCRYLYVQVHDLVLGSLLFCRDPFPSRIPFPVSAPLWGLQTVPDRTERIRCSCCGNLHRLEGDLSVLHHFTTCRSMRWPGDGHDEVLGIGKPMAGCTYDHGDFLGGSSCRQEQRVHHSCAAVLRSAGKETRMRNFCPSYLCLPWLPLRSS